MGNTILLEQEQNLQKELISLFTTSQTGEGLAKNLKTLLNGILPKSLGFLLSLEIS